jgi:hypothetical protein
MKASPYPSARTFLACSLALRALYHVVFLLADILRFWRRPQRYDPELLRLWHDMNWYYKSARPVTRPDGGRKETAHFRRFRTDHAASLPPGFLREESITVSAVGDLMGPSGTENSAGLLYERVGELVFGADVSIANLESTPTSGAIEQTRARLGEAPKINCTREQYEALKGHSGRSYTVVSVANNPILDGGLEGVRFTWELLNSEGFHPVGLNWSPGARGRATFFERSGFRLGFATGTYSVNLRPYPEGMGYLVNEVAFHKFHGAVDVSLLESQLADCRDRHCDFAILILHWGMEFELYPRWEQVEIAHRLAERGADLIVSHHPHNIQPFELYRTNRDPERLVPITYSLGNLTSIFGSPFCSLSLVLNLQLTRGRLPSGRRATLVERLVMTPVIQTAYSDGGQPKIRIERLAESLDRRSPRSPRQRRFFTRAAKYADRVLGHEWRKTERDA